MKILLLLLLAIPTLALSGVCNVRWTHDNLRTDETPITDGEMLFEIEIKGQIKEVIGVSRGYGYFIFGECPSCIELRIRAVDKIDMTLKSIWTSPVCPPDTPIICN